MRVMSSCESVNPDLGTLTKRRVLILFVILAGSLTQRSAAQLQDGCALPSSLREQIASRYPNSHVVSGADLGDGDEKQFQQEHGSECPGLASVNFYGDGKPTLAVVLFDDAGRATNAQLVLAHELQRGWELRSLERNISGPVPVVWGERPGKYDDVYGEKTVAAVSPVIVLCSYDSWAILYAWVGNRVEKVWIRD